MSSSPVPGATATPAGVPTRGFGTTWAPATVRGGPRHVNFVIAAATSADMALHRRDLQQYGPDSYDWSPYRPQLHQRICVFAQTIAAGQDLTSGLARADEIEELLDQANEANELVVLLIDVWATRLDAYRLQLSRYDLRNEPTSPMMVPWSSSDPETFENSEELRVDLFQTFPRNLTRRDDLIRTEIADPDAFQRELVSALTEAQSRVFRLRPVVQRAGGDVLTERPVLGLPRAPGDPPDGRVQP
nr:FxsC protein [Kineosporia babensis]